MSTDKRRYARTLVMFGYDWDAIAFAKLQQRWPLAHYGFDLFTFPSNARLAMFDMQRFCALAAVKARLTGAKAVVSNHEQFGALAAALLAERMGWPGTPVEAVLACQHKLHARRVLQRVAPAANPGFQRLDVEYGGDVPDDLAYPAFVKPVKAAFSVLARQVGNRAELADHTRFGPWELWVIKHLVQPFEKIVRQRLPEAGTAHSLMLETPMRGRQYCLDGYVFKGDCHTLGVVDAVMYPGTDAFMRFDYPSRLDAPQVAQAQDIARRFLREIGFDHGLFNMEFIVDAQTGQVKVIEFNPRLAAQFSDLYARVDGIDLHEIALALGHGIDPETLPRAQAVAGCASSFVYRSFDPDATVMMPGKRQLRRLQGQFPDSLLFRFPKKPQEIHRDFKWLGSYRYGILHLGGRDPDHLRLRCEQASALLDWPAPYAGQLGSIENLPDEVGNWTGDNEIEKVTG
jgi:hypothetical protein